MTEPCAQSEATLAMYVDGELDADEAEAFALHLASCEACRAGLHDALQLVAVETRAAAPKSDALATPSRTARERARRWGARSRWLIAAPLVAAAAIAILWIALPHSAGPPPIALVTAPVRSLEGRVSYAPADAHRDYAVVRAGAPAASADAVPFDALAKLEQRGDRHGVAAGYLLLGDPARAEPYLDSAAPSPDVAADRALVRLIAGHPDDALIALDLVLEAAPRHPQALWNRALALRDLGLTRMASQAFTAVAALGEPGWAGEATERARALRDEADQRAARFAQLTAAGAKLASAPAGIPPELARRIPGATRQRFLDAVRGAATADALSALAPLARTLDEIAGDTVASERLARAAHADWTKRGPLAARYAALVAGAPITAADATTYLAALGAAQQDDVLLGALLRIHPAGLPPADLAELQRLAAASADPWDRMIAVEQDLRAGRTGDPTPALRRALPVARSCTPQLDPWCTQLDLALADIYLATGRFGDAREALAEGIARARRGSDEALETLFLARLASVETTRPALGRAYNGEFASRRR